MNYKDILLAKFKEYATKCSAAQYFKVDRTSSLHKIIHKTAVAFLDDPEIIKILKDAIDQFEGG